MADTRMIKVLISGGLDRSLLMGMLSHCDLKVEAAPDMDVSMGSVGDSGYGAVVASHLSENDASALSAILKRCGQPPLILVGQGPAPDYEDTLRLDEGVSADEVVEACRATILSTSEEVPTGLFDVRGLVGQSEGLKRVLNVARKVASTDSTVLITGESGTGKELIARAIHRNSPRHNAPLVVINCGAIPGELLESELFGHEKGAFTGAYRSRPGRFELANGGTIFLDEIGDMSPDLQVKLLRAIQEKCFERVGGTSSIHVDIRIISATNKDLAQAVAQKRFREDLYYRLNVIPVIMPPLRDRRSDIPLLAEHFMEKLSRRTGMEKKRFAPETLEIMGAYDWPGNVRELENLVERFSVLVDANLVERDDLPDHFISDVSGHSLGAPFYGDSRGGVNFHESVEQHQKSLILQALHESNWVKAKAAELLNMKRTTLVEKIKKMKIEECSTSPSL
ncbi:sigma-54 dependent transcriptional regulator [Desulfoluna sp.]|uniref:sigma-54 interaction domain-containing protein n=1 Tax=Desulfoluna sp. TaxID=2045199 RepID=UPI0026355F1E|nr:sigma-54 dependent transcriptional regulator [Desulfoluna sp.]